MHTNDCCQLLSVIWQVPTTPGLKAVIQERLWLIAKFLTQPSLFELALTFKEVVRP